MKLAALRSGGGEPEIFHSVQGEGRYAGQPRTFVRSSLCNLYCVWCDTDYTWNWRGTRFRHRDDHRPEYEKFDKGEEIVELEPERVADLVAAQPGRAVVLTGGEPLLHQNDWVRVMEVLRERDPAWRFEVETNGTLAPGDAFDSLADYYAVSPKLTSSGVEQGKRLRPSLGRFADLAREGRADFKFVVAGRGDLAEIVEITSTHRVPPDRVFLMPEGRTAERLAETTPAVRAAATTHGFLFSDRLHVHRFGSRRGT
jgi:7-carboxy-7-deazaguanine synthase